MRSKPGTQTLEIATNTDWKLSKNALLLTDPSTFHCRLLQSNNRWGMKPAQLIQADNIEQSQSWPGEPWRALWLVQTIQTFIPCSALSSRPVTTAAGCCFVKFHTTHRHSLQSTRLCFLILHSCDGTYCFIPCKMYLACYVLMIKRSCP